MTKLLIVSKNEKGLIEISEEDFRAAIDNAQSEAYDDGIKLGYLRGQADTYSRLCNQNNSCNCDHECKNHSEE